MACVLIPNSTNTFIGHPTIRENHRCENKVIDDFMLSNYKIRNGKMEFVPYNNFKDIEFIAEGGFSKVYKATWIDGPYNWNGPLYYRNGKMTVALKELNNSKNITSEELNEV